jgi:hypothetical protein
MNKTVSPSPKSAILKEGVDFIFNDAGLMVLTREYHLKRGYCCSSGCQNCPYGYGEKVDPSIPVEFQMSHQKSGEADLSAEEYLEKYSEYLEGDQD